VNEGPVRRPGGLARFALLVTTAAAFLEVFAVGFPPASHARLPLLVLSAGLAAVAAWNRGRGMALFAFLFPLCGLGDRLAGGSDAVAWPVLLFLGLAAGWTFRFLYDFESPPDPTRADRILRGLLVLWTLSLALAVVRARTVWAALRGLRLRAVNVDGLPDALAIRTSLLSFAALACGAAFFFMARRAGRNDRERALRAALAGTVRATFLAAAAPGTPAGSTDCANAWLQRAEGDMSYALYLTHLLSFSLVAWIVAKLAISPAGHAWTYFAATLATGLLIAAATYLMVEKPTTNFLKRWIERPRLPVAPAMPKYAALPQPAGNAGSL